MYKPLLRSLHQHRLVLSLDALITLKTISSDLLVITLKRSQVLTSLREFTLLHTLTNIPVHESTLGVHEVELVRKRAPGFGNSGCVGEHAHSAANLGQIAVGHGLRGLVADTDLETGGAPVDKLDGALGLELGNGIVGALGDDITTVEQAGGHVLSVARVALDHLVVGLEAGIGDFHNGVGLVGGLCGGDDRRVGNEREVDTRVGHQVGLELVQVNVQGTIETEGGSDRRDD